MLGVNDEGHLHVPGSLEATGEESALVYVSFTRELGTNQLHLEPRLKDLESVQNGFRMNLHSGLVQMQPQELPISLLGVRMAPDGSFTNEFQYRLQLVREMEMKLAAAPFDTGDVLTVYQVR